MNDIAVRSNTGIGLINRDDLAKSLNTAAAQMPAVGGDKQYIKMLTKGRDAGEWVFGQSDMFVEKDDLWAINPSSIKHGYVAWDTNAGGAPVQELMLPINRPLPPRNALPELPPGTPSKKAPGVPVELEYQDQRSVDLVCVSGENVGVVVEYKQSSKGAMKLFNKIINGLLDQIQKGDEIVPVGKFGFSSYDHSSYGETYNPEFEIVEWRTPEDTSPVNEETAVKNAKDVSPKEEAPARTRTRAAAPEPEPEAEQQETAEDLAAQYQKVAAETGDAAAPRRRRQRR